MKPYKQFSHIPSKPTFDPNLEDTSSSALGQMYAQGFRHVRGLGYVKLEDPPRGWDVDPHDIEGYVFSPPSVFVFVPYIRGANGVTRK